MYINIKKTNATISYGLILKVDLYLMDIQFQL